MLVPVVLTFLSVPFALAGLLHTGHPHEVLDNIHKTPHCAYTCIFDEKLQLRWAPECAGLKPGKDIGSCYCHANAYRYILDQCIERKCGAKERQEARKMSEKSCKFYGVDKKDMYELEKIKGLD